MMVIFKEISILGDITPGQTEAPGSASNNSLNTGWSLKLDAFLNLAIFEHSGYNK